MSAGAEPGSRRGRGRRREERLSADDWVAGALALLEREGVGAVKVARLCAELGVTKGSFYWHFADLDELVAAVADAWSARTSEAHDRLAELQGLPPRERLERMAAQLLEDGAPRVERTLRDWAATNSQIADVIAASDRRIFELVRQALVDVGVAERGATLRAGLLVYAGIGFAQRPSRLPRPSGQDISAMFDLLLPPEPPGPAN